MSITYQQESQTPPDTHNWTWKDVLLIVLGAITIFILGIITLFVSLAIFNQSNILNGSQLVITSLLAALMETIALLGSVYLLGIRRRDLPGSAVGIVPISKTWIRNAIVIGVFAIPISSLIALGVQILLGLPTENPQLPFLIPENLTPPTMLILALLVGIFIPFAEEIFFRGVLYQWLRQRLGISFGIIVSSLIFGIIHGEISIAVAASILGIVLAWVYEKSGSVWPGFIIHSINNGVKIVVLYVLVLTGGL